MEGDSFVEFDEAGCILRDFCKHRKDIGGGCLRWRWFERGHVLGIYVVSLSLINHRDEQLTLTKRSDQV